LIYSYGILSQLMLTTLMDPSCNEPAIQQEVYFDALNTMFEFHRKSHVHWNICGNFSVRR
jgi:hypothetical protein